MRPALKMFKNFRRFISSNASLKGSDCSPQSAQTPYSNIKNNFLYFFSHTVSYVRNISSVVYSSFLVFFFLINVPSSFASVEINLKALSQIESSNNPHAVSFLGSRYGRGLYQVSEVALKDYLRYHKEERITPDDLFVVAINERVARWLLEKRIPQILRSLKRPVTLETVLSAYNKGYSPILAKDYINRYKKAERKEVSRGKV